MSTEYIDTYAGYVGQKHYNVYWKQTAKSLQIQMNEAHQPEEDTGKNKSYEMHFILKDTNQIFLWRILGRGYRPISVKLLPYSFFIVLQLFQVKNEIFARTTGDTQ